MSHVILIVDDSETLRHQVCTVLHNGGFATLEAADGLEGMQMITERPDLSLVLCDVNMPRLGGLEMLEFIQAQGKLGDLPVVMLTSEGQTALVRRAKAAGAKGWIVKPFQPELLLAAVKKLTSG